MVAARIREARQAIEPFEAQLKAWRAGFLAGVAMTWLTALLAGLLAWWVIA